MDAGLVEIERILIRWTIWRLKPRSYILKRQAHKWTEWLASLSHFGDYRNGETRQHGPLCVQRARTAFRSVNLTTPISSLIVYGNQLTDEQIEGDLTMNGSCRTITERWGNFWFLGNSYVKHPSWSENKNLHSNLKTDKMTTAAYHTTSG